MSNGTSGRLPPVPDADACRRLPTPADACRRLPTPAGARRRTPAMHRQTVIGVLTMVGVVVVARVSGGL
ncbi:hypothetical protein, partial [Streptomyces ossamyceticus]|uniref:hypothetical protein n=1 Tax=Streptomyces ossamyceticus TaxID=249581 RepID=UPI00342C5123